MNERDKMVAKRMALYMGHAEEMLGNQPHHRAEQVNVVIAAGFMMLAEAVGLVAEVIEDEE